MDFFLLGNAWVTRNGSTHDFTENPVGTMRPGTLRFELLENAEGFPRLEAAWGSLCDELADCVTVFASHAWYQSWWEHYRGDAGLCLFTMWQDERLAGIAPLMMKKTSLHGFPLRTVGFIQNNQSLHNDFIVLPEYRTLFLENLIRTLCLRSSEWDMIYFRNVSPLSANCQSLVEVLGAERRDWKQALNPISSPYLNPSASWSDYFAHRPKRAQKSLRNIRNKIGHAGEISVKNIRTWEDFLSCREELFEVAKSSWTEQVGDSLGSLMNRGFFEALSLRTAAKGWLSIWTLSLSGKMIALEYHLRAYGREHALRGHYHPDFANLSPGTFLEMAILNHIFEETEKVRTYDFCGGFDIYKRKWTETFVPHCDVYVFSRRTRSRFAKFLEFTLFAGLREVVRYLRQLQKTRHPAPSH